MKKINMVNLFLLLIMLIPINVLAGGSSDDSLSFDLKYTSDSCITSDVAQCIGNSSCYWSEEKGCGVSLGDTSYKCYYYLKSGSVNSMVTAYFNSNGISSLEYITDDPSNFGNKAVVNETPTPIIKEQRDQLIIYTCPDSLYYSTDDTEQKEEDGTTVFYRAFSTTKKSNYDVVFSLLKDENYSGIMMVKKVGQQVEPVLPPKVCTYTKKVGNDKRTITITYHDKSNVSINYTGLTVSGMINKADTSYILNSQYFKDWECPSENLVYAYIDEENVLHVAYNKEDLGDHDNIFEYNGNDGDYNPGKDAYGCEIVPDEVQKWIRISLNFVKYVALVLVVVLGTIDFIKAAGSGEPDAMKKAGQSFMKRVVAVIILFLLPMLVDLILHLINLYGSTDDCFGVLK